MEKNALVKNITFSAEEDLIRKARERAAAKQTTLNDEFRKWLENYAERSNSRYVYRNDAAFRNV